jgi:serine/threonine protein kinase
MRELPEGQGTYGCIVDYQTYKCSGDPDMPSEPMISKVMTDEDAFYNEMNVAELLKPIDPEQIYLIYAKSGCEIDKAAFSIDCEGDYFDRLANKIYVITMKSGGISLEGFINNLKGTKIQLDVTLRLVNDILKGLHILHQGGISHRDISPKNITIADIPGSAVLKRAYIIDFGLSEESNYMRVEQDMENAFEIFRILLYNTEVNDEIRKYYRLYFEKPKFIDMLPSLDKIREEIDTQLNSRGRVVNLQEETAAKRNLFGSD